MFHIILKKIVKFLPFLLIVFVLGGSTYYFYSRFQKAQWLLQNPNAAAKEETDTLIAKVAAFMELPKGETPQIATIIDVTKLKDQPFFANAKNGDEVIIYMNAKKAILFRPDTNRIIDIEPLYIGSASTNPTTQLPSQTASIRIAIYNGTDTAGLAQVAQTDLVNKFVGIQIVSKSDAKRHDYETTLVIDLTGNKKDVASILAKDLNATITSLPPGEATPSASTDFLVILGKNYGK